MERISRIRQTDKHHHFTLVCRDLSEIAKYRPRQQSAVPDAESVHARVPTHSSSTATRETPKRLQNPKRSTIGIRVPDHVVPRLLLSELGEPIMSSTLLLPGDELPMTDAREIQERLLHSVDAVIDGGNCGLEPTSVIDLAGPAARASSGVARATSARSNNGASSCV